MQKISNKYTFFILMLISLSAFATEKIQSILGDERVIPPEQAFKFNYLINNNTLKLIWEIESGYYMYKDSFALISDKQISPINIDKIKWIVKDDPFLGIKKVIYNKYSFLSLNLIFSLNLLNFFEEFKNFTFLSPINL